MLAGREWQAHAQNSFRNSSPSPGPFPVTMATVFNSSVYVHGSRSCVKMCMPLITYRLSSFHFKRLWPGFNSHCLLTESLDPGLGRGAEDKVVRHEHPFGMQRHWRRGRQGLVCGGLHWMLRRFDGRCHVPDILWQWQVWSLEVL